jgi:hypothetical protein
MRYREGADTLAKFAEAGAAGSFKVHALIVEPRRTNYVAIE